MKLEKETALYNENAIKNAIEEKTQFFWNNSSGEFAGTHMTEIPESDFKTTPSGGNLWLNSDEMSLRYGKNLRLYDTKLITDPPIKMSNKNKGNESSYFIDGENAFFPILPWGPGGEYSCKELLYVSLVNFKLYLPGIISGQPVWPETGIDTDLVLRNTNKASSGTWITLFEGTQGKKVEVAWTSQDDTLWLVFRPTNLDHYSYEIEWNSSEMSFIPNNVESSSTILGRYFGDDDDDNPPLLGCKVLNQSYSEYVFKVSHDGNVYSNNLIVANHDSPVGTVQNSAWTSTIPGSVSTNWRHLNGYSSVILSPGVYVVNVCVRFTTTESGSVYGLSVGYQGTTSRDYYRNSRVSMKSSGGTIQLTTSYITSLTKYNVLAPCVYGDGAHTLGRFSVQAVRIV